MFVSSLYTFALKSFLRGLLSEKEQFKVEQKNYDDPMLVIYSKEITMDLPKCLIHGVQLNVTFNDQKKRDLSNDTITVK